MKRACVVLIACVLFLIGCRDEDTVIPDVATDTIATDTAIATAETSNPYADAADKIRQAMITERDARRTELMAREQSKDPVATRDWKQFRRTFPYHIQEIAVSERQGKERTVIVAEPPPFASLEEIVEAAGDGLVGYEVKKNPIGYDGWVKDVVLRLSGDDVSIANAVSRLTYALFKTTYKAHVLPLPAQVVRHELDLDLDVTPAEIENWLIEEGEVFVPVLGGAPATVDEIFGTTASRVFFSKGRGLVAWWIPAETRVDALASEVRQFALDSDLIIGAIHRAGGTLVIARERAVPVDDLPPLRFETVALLAGVSGEARDELGQSYERNAPFAGAIAKRWDWAPIFLSPELVDTEYGSLLNITDQLLKGWSKHGQTTYLRFDQYPKPSSYPFPGSVRDELQTQGSVTYNWNTTGVGYSVDAGGSEIFALYRTGALPVSYIPDGVPRSDPRVLEVEQTGYEYFAGIRDPNLIRVVQYAALYQVFSAYRVKANVPPKNRQPHELRETIEAELLAELRSSSEEEQEQLAQKLADRVTDYLLQRLDAGDEDTDRERVREDVLLEVREDVSQAATGEAPPMSIALSAYADLRDVLQRYKAAGDLSTGWIHTPLVVLSQNARITTGLLIGGHNLYANRTRMSTADDLPVGTARVTDEGIQLNPRDAARAREVQRIAARDRRANLSAAEVERNVNDALRRMPPPRPPRARFTALRFPGGNRGAKPPRPPFRGRSTGDHGGNNGWNIDFGGTPPTEWPLPGMFFIERRDNRTIRILFEGGEARAATVEDATDVVTQLMKNGKGGSDGVRLELRGFQPGDAHNFVRNCNRRNTVADAEVSAMVTSRKLDANAAAEILTRKYDFSRINIRPSDITKVNGRPEATIIVDIPRADAARVGHTEVTVGFHQATEVPVARTLLGDIRSAIQRITKDQTDKLNAFVFNHRLNQEIKAISRRTGVPIDIVRQQFVDAKDDIFFVEIQTPIRIEEGDEERRRS